MWALGVVVFKLVVSLQSQGQSNLKVSLRELSNESRHSLIKEYVNDVAIQ